MYVFVIYMGMVIDLDLDSDSMAIYLGGSFTKSYDSWKGVSGCRA